MATRTGDVGNVYYYDAKGIVRRDTDQITIEVMVRSSAFHGDYCQYVHDGYVTWAKGGREIPAPAFASTLEA